MAKALLKNGKIALFAPYEDRELCKQIDGRQPCYEGKRFQHWEYPLRPEVLAAMRRTFPGLTIAPEVTRAVTAVEMREVVVAQMKDTGWEKAQPDESMPLKTKPFQCQVMGFNIGIKLPGTALFMEQGCGKSLTAIAVMGRRFQRGEINRVLIIAPTSVVPVWAKEDVGEFAVHANFPYDVQALDGPIEKRIMALESWPEKGGLQVAVTNYEAVWRMEAELARWDPDMIICDESQRIKTPGARQSKAVHKLGRLAKYRMILTGTPVTQGPLDLFSAFKFLDPGIFGNSFWAFKARYAVTGGFNGKQVVAYKNLPDLVRKAHSIAFRVTKADALDLPEFTDQTLYCKLETKAKNIYEQMKKESVAELSEERIITATNVLSRLLRLSQLTGGYIGDGEGAIEQVSAAKFNLLRETVDDLLEVGKKVVIFARFIPEIHAIVRFLENTNIGHACIMGSVKMEDRGEEVRRFQQDPDCRVFVAQIQTAGLGITLTAADTAIFYSLDYSFANLAQAQCRIHRISQRNFVTYIYLVAENTVDEKILQILKKKKSVADMVVDGWRDLF